jgi:NADP-dependent 3-hydroxy acid dehydrogenase YdfG
MAQHWQGKHIVLITGATGRVGAAAARLLAGAGHHVVLGARGEGRLAQLAAEIREAGGSVGYRVVDVTDADDAQTFVLAAQREFGRVDVLLNGAGMAPLARLDTLKLAEWQRMVAVNLHGALNTIAAVLPLMRIAGSGHVINLAEEGTPPGTGAAVLGATHAAVRALSDSLRQEEPHLRVSVIAPGKRSETAVARAIAGTVGQAGLAQRHAPVANRPFRCGGDGRGTSAAQRRSPPPASPC